MVTLLAGSGVVLLGFPGTALGAPSPVTGTISGPAFVGTSLRGVYVVTGSGGPAEAANGTIVGIYSYRANVSAANTTGTSVSPTSGVLINQSVSLTFFAPPVPETVTLTVEITSGAMGKNQSTNITYSIAIVQPYRLTATLVVASASGVLAFSLVVFLDGAIVGSVSVPGLTGGQSYPVNFTYVTAGLSAGWHSFSISLAKEHGLVTFPGGLQEYIQSFYVAGPTTDYTIWYVAGAVAFFGAIFIFLPRVAARRRGRTKK